MEEEEEVIITAARRPVLNGAVISRSLGARSLPRGAAAAIKVPVPMPVQLLTNSSCFRFMYEAVLLFYVHLPTFLLWHGRLNVSLVVSDTELFTIGKRSQKVLQTPG